MPQNACRCTPCDDAVAGVQVPSFARQLLDAAASGDAGYGRGCVFVRASITDRFSRKGIKMGPQASSDTLQPLACNSDLLLGPWTLDYVDLGTLTSLSSVNYYEGAGVLPEASSLVGTSGQVSSTAPQLEGGVGDAGQPGSREAQSTSSSTTPPSSSDRPSSQAAAASSDSAGAVGNEQAAGPTVGTQQASASAQVAPSSSGNGAAGSSLAPADREELSRAMRGIDTAQLMENVSGQQGGFRSYCTRSCLIFMLYYAFKQVRYKFTSDSNVII